MQAKRPLVAVFAFAGTRRAVTVGGALLVLCLAVSATMAAATNPSPFGNPTAQDRVLIQLDGTRALSVVALDLAAAGYPTIAKFDGVSDRHNYRCVFVTSSSDQTLAAIRAIPGIATVRRVYQVPGLSVPLIHTGQAIVKFKPGVSSADVAAIAAKYGATIERQISWLSNVYVLSVPDTNDSDAMTVAAALAQDSQTVYSQPDLFMKGLLIEHAVDIQDPLFPYQWHLRNTGQLWGGKVGADVNAVAAWEITEGTGAIVAVLDDCVQRDHEDLVENYLTGYDFTDNDGDPGPGFPDDAHGVATSGLVVASGNSLGVRGVAPRASLIGVRALAATMANIAEAFRFAESNGAQVISNSWGPVGFDYPTVAPMLNPLLADAVKTVATQGRGGLGCLVLVSSGNGAMPLAFDNPLAAVPNAVAIGATNRDDVLTCYSAYGEEQSVVAPGGGGTPSSTNTPTSVCYEADITTTDVQDELFDLDPLDNLPTYLGYNPAVTYPYPYLQRVLDKSVQDFPNTAYTHYFNGTSAACPVAAGVATLAFSMNPGMTAREARNLLEHTAAKVNVPNIHYDGVTGHNIYMGHGRVDAYAAVLAAQAAKSWPSPVKDIQNISSQSLARILWSNPDWDDDGTVDEDVAGDLVVRGPLGQLEWAPVDGIVYTVGQQVAPGVIVVANDLITSLDQTGLPMGDFEYAIFVRNAANYYSWGRRTSFSSSGSVTVPLASIQTSVNTGPAPLAVHFAGGGIDSSGIASYTWTFGDGQTGSGATIDHTFTTTGRYTVTLKVTNTVGQMAQTTTVINVLSGTNAIPVAAITATPTSGEVPLAVLFVAAAADSDGRVVRYDWNFGDGSVATGQTVEHVYLDPGTFGVTLTAIDNSGGEGMASALITVTAAPTTAAQTVTTTSTTQSLLSGCGAGSGSALLVGCIGLCGLMALRRRR